MNSGTKRRRAAATVSASSEVLEVAGRKGHGVASTIYRVDSESWVSGQGAARSAFAETAV